MSYQKPFAGYPGQVWATCYQALAWFNSLLLLEIPQSRGLTNPARLVFHLLRDGAVAIDAWQTAQALSHEEINLASIRALPLGLDPVTQGYFDARVNAVTAATDGITALPRTADAFSIVAQLQSGVTDVLNPRYLEWCMGFTGEAPPAGLTAATIPDFAASEAAAWLAVTQSINTYQGNNLTTAYDAAARMYRCSAVVANTIASMRTLPFVTTDMALLWNNIVALPGILLAASSVATAPSTLIAQQGLAIRFTLNQMAIDMAIFIHALQTSIGKAPITAILANTDTLMDVAARETGDFENWVEIARINGLVPPWPGPTNQAVAMNGKQLYMPGSNVTVGTDAVAPTYPDSVMGVDYYFGPINGIQPVWNGELASIRGLLNFAQALGRRLQTPIGTLVYHQEYGSRIPAEVGAVQSADEAARLAAFGKAALAADPRTGRIISAEAFVRPGMLATFAGVVTPIGPGTVPVNLNVNIPPA